MWESREEIDVAVPVEMVYERLRDLGRHAEFAEGLETVRQVTPGEPGVGTRYRAEERVPGRYTSEAELTRLERPLLVAWRAWVKGVMRTEWEYRLAPTATGTRLVQISRWSAASPVGFVMLNLHRKRHAPGENRRTLERIKSVLEAESESSAENVPTGPSGELGHPRRGAPVS